MDLMERRKVAILLVTTIGLVWTLSTVAFAHEHRHVGSVEMTVGWVDEPTFVGFKNAAQLILNSDGKPILDLGDTLKVEVIFGNDKLGPLPLQRAFGATFGRPGDYHAPLIPTRAGTYTFHFIGTIKNEKVDQSFTCSEKTFDCAAESSAIEFPAKDPSRAELAGRLDRLSPRLDTAQAAVTEAADAASTARTMGIIGIVLAIIALAVVFLGGRGRARA